MRYINSLNLSDSIKCFVLIEPGLGYMIPVLKEKFPNSKVVALYVGDSNAEKLLENEIEDLQASKIKIIEWRASMDFYKDAYVKLLRAAIKIIKRTDAQTRTVKHFEKRWEKNSKKNQKYAKNILRFKQTDIPVIVIGSGPGLENCAFKIKELQNSCLLIAASSCVTALARHNINFDLVITTDGGGWALKHLYSFYRLKKNTPLAVSLTCALPSQAEESSLLLLDNLIAQTGTVTASAVELALVLSTGNIYLAGVDLGIKDIITHVRPYAFDSLFYEKANRFKPVYSLLFTRSRLLKEGGSLDIYSDWFKKQLEGPWAKRVFYFDGNLTAGCDAGEKKNEIFYLS